MKRGPKPTPTKILQLRGSWRANRPDEPQGQLVRLEPPAWLLPDAKDAFAELAEVIYGLGVSTKADVLALAMLAESIILYRKATEELVRDGLSTATETGGRKSHPALIARSQAWSEIARGLAMFGLDPGDRARASKAGPPAELDEDTLADMGAALMEKLRQKGAKRRGKRTA